MTRSLRINGMNTEMDPIAGSDQSPSGVAESANNISQIKHVFVLMLENRAFDHMLGYSAISGTDAVTGNPTQLDGLPANGGTNYDTDQTPYQTAGPAPFQMPEDPPHEYDDIRLQLLGSNAPTVNYDNTDVTNSGFVISYKQVAGCNPLGGIMACFDPTQLPVLNALAKEFCVCDRWFASLPGPTIPNRLFLHAATCGGDPDSPSTFVLLRSEVDGSVSYKFANGNVFQRMTTLGLPWALYHGDTFAMAYVLDGVSFGSGKQFDPRDAGQLEQFQQDLNGPNLPGYIFIEPNWGNLLPGTYKGGTSQHPMDDVTSGEGLIKAVYEAIRGSACWNNSVLIVVYDEHGGFYDHVPPPGGVPAPQDVPNKYQFGFNHLGARVPAIIISPWIPKNLIDHTQYDHTSVLATLRCIFPQLGYFTQRDMQANDLSHLFSLAQPRADAPMTLPPVAQSGIAAAPLQALDTIPDSAFQSFPGASARITSTQVGFLHAALKHDLQLSPKKDRKAILDRVGKIRTIGDAKLYMRDVQKRLNAKPAKRAKPAGKPRKQSAGKSRK
jgi:phospholipase C